MSLLKHSVSRMVSTRVLSTVLLSTRVLCAATLSTKSASRRCFLHSAYFPSTELQIRQKATIGLLRSRSMTNTSVHRTTSGRSFYDGTKDEDESPYVLLRGLPFEATEQDIINFLEGVGVAGGARDVTFILNKAGLRRGTAFVKVNSKGDVDKALALSKNHISNRYIEVFRSDERNMNKDIAFHGNQPMRSKTGHTIDMISIPADTKEQEIFVFFSPLTPAKIELRTVHGKDWTNHKAHVDFSSHKDACVAMEKNKAMLGNKVISLKLVSYNGTCTAYQDG